MTRRRLTLAIVAMSLFYGGTTWAQVSATPTSATMLGWKDVRTHGAKADAVRVLATATNGGKIAASSANLTVVGAAFTQADVGKTIVVPGAGASAAYTLTTSGTSYLPLVTTIQSVTDATHVTLAATATTTIDGSTNTRTLAGGSTITYGTNNTTAIQAALNSGSPVAYLYPGNYLCAGTLNVPDNVALVGSWAGPTGHDEPGIVQPPSNNPVGNGGSVLYTTTGANTPTGTAFLTLNRNSNLSGVVIYQPGQSETRASTPVRYPFAVFLTGGSCGSVENVELTNVYQGIKLGGDAGTIPATTNRGRVNNVVGQPLYVGLELRDSYDSVRLSNIHWIPLAYYSDGTTQGPTTGLAAWCYANSIGYYIWGADDFHFENCYTFNNLVGFLFVAAPNHTITSTAGSYGTLTNCSADRCKTPCRVDSTNPNGVNIHGGTWVTFSTAVFLVSGGTLTVHGAHGFHDAAVTGPAWTVTGGHFSAVGCYFNTTAAGQSGGTVIATGNRFAVAATVTVSTGAAAYAITGNMAPTAFTVTNTSGLTGGAAISANNASY